MTGDSLGRERALPRQVPQPRARYESQVDGILRLANVHHNLPPSFLCEEAVLRGEGRLADFGPLVVRTGPHTSRAPKDKFLVKEASSEPKVWWTGGNQGISEQQFGAIWGRMLRHLQGKTLFVQDRSLCAEPAHRMSVRIITETAWHSLVARNLFRSAVPQDDRGQRPPLTIVHAPGFHAIAAQDGTHSDSFIILHLGLGLALIGGTAYAGEVKKVAFTFANYVLPEVGVLTMHAAANMGSKGDVAIFLGLSGTGKTTLSTDGQRRLLADDELGWGDRNVFNLEGGCYAKVTRLSEPEEPEIFGATRRFGTVLENVCMDAKTGGLDLNDARLTENGRASYPLSHIPGAVAGGLGPDPTNILLLTADAFGVLPPIAKLTPEQAVYHFLSGYTARIPGMERGEELPTAVFSPCFGGPFLALPPTVYAKQFQERLRRHPCNIWLLNTGWTGGPFGTGERIPISATRALVRAALDGSLAQVTMRLHEGFGVQVPTWCPGVSTDLLDPRGTWPDRSKFRLQAARLVGMFRANFEQFGSAMGPEVAAAGPSLLGAVLG